MEEKYLRVLEYDKILKMLSEKAVCISTKNKILELTPETEFEKIEIMLNETDEALRYTVKHSDVPIIPLNDIEKTLKRVKIGAVLSCKELLDIARVLKVTRILKKYMAEAIKEDFPNLYLASECLIEIIGTEREIERCIISDEEISDEASPILRDIRRKKIKLTDKIRDVLDGMIHSSKYQNVLQENLVTMRAGRYVLPVKAEHKGSVSGIIHDASSKGATVFIEPMQVVEINNEIHRLNAEEKEEEERILTSLTDLVEQSHNQIKEDYAYIINIDMIFSKAKLALSMDAVKPILNREGIINIKKGRHPLIDKKKIVPIDVFLGKDFDTLVITGPNTGGKTVTLKTLGLFTVMAQTGLNIPCDFGSEISVFKKVFADIGDEQSIEQSLSTFSSHIVNIVKILSEADDSSLVLFDELGAGTDPLEGAALAISILEYVKMCGAKTAATTHYSEIKLYALSTERVENAACEFDIETLCPTYKLLIGIPGKSNAFAIAKRLGISDYIISGAKDHLTAENIRFEDVALELEKNRQSAEKAKFEAERLKRENEEAQKKILFDREKIDRQKDELLKEARREAKAIVKSAQKKMETLIKEIVAMQEKVSAEEAKKAANEAKRKMSDIESVLEEELSEEILTPKNNKVPKSLTLGQEVELIALGQRGNVMTLPDDKGNLIVQAGILKVTTNIKALREIDAEKRKEKKEISSGKVSVSKTQSAVTELDIRGQMADEALLNLEKFIDDAFIAKIETLRVIHGKGTGVLRNVVQQYCKKNKRIKAFRPGMYGEGENGVTVITLAF